MKLTKILSAATLGVAILSLAACSTVGTNNGASGSANGQDQGSNSTTTGLGQQGEIQGMNLSQSMLLRAPHNQSYYFGFDKYNVKSNYLASIDAQANYLIRHPRTHILLTGNTDARGSHEYNIALGEKRALAVDSRLKMDGVNVRQIRMVSYGDMRPLALGHSETAYARNRRVDLIYSRTK